MKLYKIESESEGVLITMKICTDKEFTLTRNLPIDKHISNILVSLTSV